MQDLITVLSNGLSHNSAGKLILLRKFVVNFFLRSRPVEETSLFEVRMVVCAWDNNNGRIFLLRQQQGY